MMDLSGQLILKKVHNHLLDQPDHEIKKGAQMIFLDNL